MHSLRRDTMTIALNPTIDDNGTKGSIPNRVIVFLKWSKQVVEFDITIPTPPTNTDGTNNINEDSNKFTGRSFKDVVYSLTKVPVDRQKVVVAKSKSNKSSTIKWWKGILKDDFDFSSALATRDTNVTGGASTGPIELRATLMGTAEILVSNKDQNKTIFLEDMTPAEKKAEERRELMNSMDNVSAMIPALQVPPLDRQPPINGNNIRDDDKDNGGGDKAIMPIISDFEENRAYDRLVHGFSQLRIDALLRHQQQKPQTNQQPKEKDPSKALISSPRLMGRAVMTMGLELQRAYVNDLAVLNEDGTLVSGLDDGHIHLWKHCHRINDLIHQFGGGFGGFGDFLGVESVLALDHDQGLSPASFATAGRGCIRVWNSEGEPLLGHPSPLPYASPTGMVRIPIGSATTNHAVGGIDIDINIVCLAARFRIARPPSRRPRLVPQDNAGRSRVAEIEASEAMMNENLTKLSKCVQILFFDTASSSNGSNANNPTLRSLFLNAPNPVTALASWKDDGNTQFLAVGDDQGGILFWKIALAASSSSQDAGAGSTGLNLSNSSNGASRLSYTKLRYVQIASLENPSESRSAIVCMKYVNETKQLWVSTKEIPAISISSSSSSVDVSLWDVATTCLPLKPPQAVHCISVDAILNNSNNESSLMFTLDGHKDMVHCVLPLPNGDLVTAGGKMDATTQVWSRSQLREAAAARTSEQGGDDSTIDNDNDNDGIQILHSSPPPPILTEAATTNLCKDAGYVFAAELLKDFKGKGGDPGDASSSSNPFAIAAARYNVVKIVI